MLGIIVFKGQGQGQVIHGVGKLDHGPSAQVQVADAAQAVVVIQSLAGALGGDGGVGLADQQVEFVGNVIADIGVAGGDLAALDGHFDIGGQVILDGLDFQPGIVGVFTEEIPLAVFRVGQAEIGGPGSGSRVDQGLVTLVGHLVAHVVTHAAAQ